MDNSENNCPDNCQEVAGQLSFFSTVVGAHEQSILILCLDQWLITDFGDLLEALITVETKQEISW